MDRVEDFNLNLNLNFQLEHLLLLIAFDTGHLTNLVANRSLLVETRRLFLLNSFPPANLDCTVLTWRTWPVNLLIGSRIVPV